MKPLCVLGAGSWGTALAMALASRFDEIRLWARDESQADRIGRERQNVRYLSGFELPTCVHVSHDLRACVSGAGIVLSVVPSPYLRAVIRSAADFIDARTPVVSATKGIEEGTLARMSELIAGTLNNAERVAVLSGPTFAREIAAGEPAAIVIAAHQMELAEEIQQAFATPALRFYTSDDVIGVETGAALKNVIALGAGICNGLGLGSNSVAALITRGLAEITRLACALGGKPATLSGLAGLGDLVLTATGHLSRNRWVGIQLGQGRKLSAILGETKMVAEGVWACQGAVQLAARHGVDLPITAKMYEVLYGDKEPRQAIRELMERPLKSE